MMDKMDITCIFLWLLLFTQIWQSGFSKLVSSRPDVVNVGALVSFDSTIGRVARIAIEEAVKDVNSNPSILHGTKLFIRFQNSNCSAFNGIAGAMQFMETDVVAIIGPQSSVAAHVISYLAKELQVPLLSFAATDPSLTPLQFPYFVRTVPCDGYQMVAVAEMVDYYGWREVIAIFIDDDFGRNGMAALEDELGERRCRISYKAAISPLPGTSQDNVRDVLVKVAMLESRIIILHVNPDLGFKVFAAANYLGMMGNGYVWITTDWLSSVLDSRFSLPTDIIDSIQGVLVLRHHIPDSPAKRMFVSRWKKVTHVSIGLNSYGFYAYDTVWLLAHAIDAFLNQNGTISFSNDTKLQSLGSGSLHLESMSIFDQGQTLLEKILHANFVGLTGPFAFDIDRSRVQPAFDIINIIGTGYRQIGYWSNYTSLSTILPEVLYTMRPTNHSTATQQLYSVIWPGGTIIKPRGWVFPNNGKRLRIGVPYRVSFREFVSEMHGTDIFKGFCIDVFTAAVSLLPYAVPFQFIPFGDGRKNPNYNELVNLINTGFFDAVVGDIAIVMNRTKMVDFTQPYAASGLVVVAPFRELNSGAWAFLRPFSPLMWCVTAGFFLVIGFVVWILEHRINDEFRGPPRKQVITILWFSFSTLFFAHREDTRSTLGRAVLIIWLFVVLIINSSYTASLTSILTVQQLLSPFKSIESLKESGEPIGYQVGSFAEYYLEEIGVPRSKLVALGSPEEYALALRRGPKGGGVAAIVDERPYVELFLSSQCNFKIIGQEFTRSGWGFAFPRDSPLAVDMSTAILQLSESGDLQRIHDKWLVKNGCSSESAEIQSDRLHLTTFVGLFVICALACLAALVIHFMQIIRRFHHAPQGGSHSGRLRTCLSIMDEKKEQSNKRSKGAREGEDIQSSDKEYDLGRSPKRRQLQVV